jgi:hypothetical protein
MPQARVPLGEGGAPGTCRRQPPQNPQDNLRDLRPGAPPGRRPPLPLPPPEAGLTPARARPTHRHESARERSGARRGAADLALPRGARVAGVDRNRPHPGTGTCSPQRIEVQGPGHGELVSRTIRGWTPYLRPRPWGASGRRGAGNRSSGRVRGEPPDDGGPETVLSAGSVLSRLGLEDQQEGERRSSVYELRTGPASLPMGFGVRAGGPEAPEDRCPEGTEVGIRAGYATFRSGNSRRIRYGPKAAEGG